MGDQDWLIGAAKADITAFIPGIVMLGYGNPHNTVKYVHAPLNAVSYTHLRAHETDSYLVCRLLLEKK